MSLIIDSYLEKLEEETELSEESNEQIFAILDESMEIMNQNILNEKSIVKMDKQTIRKRMLNQAVLAVADERKDPMYIKYQKATRLRMKMRSALRKKYGSQARSKLSEYIYARQQNAHKKPQVNVKTNPTAVKTGGKSQTSTPKFSNPRGDNSPFNVVK